MLVSLLALSISLFNFYVQLFRKREKLIGSLISIGVNEGEWDTKVEYVLSNVGDIQLVVKELEFIVDGQIKDVEVVGLPRVLKPSEVALVDFLYTRKEPGGEATEVVEFGIFSANGKGYRLPHIHRKNGVPPKATWEVFELEAEHEGF